MFVLLLQNMNLHLPEKVAMDDSSIGWDVQIAMKSHKISNIPQVLPGAPEFLISH